MPFIFLLHKQPGFETYEMLNTDNYGMTLIKVQQRAKTRVAECVQTALKNSMRQC